MDKNDSQRTIILDIETAPYSDYKADCLRDKLRYVGIKFPNKSKKIYHWGQQQLIQNIINRYSVIVGHNIKDYDISVMKRYNYKFDNKLIIDTLEIAKKRLKSMLYLDVPKNSFSLKKLGEFLNLNVKKGDFDYKLLRKPRLSMQEYRDLVTYLNNDLDLTDELYNWFYDMFYGVKEYLSLSEQRDMYWLTTASGTLSSRIKCNVLNKRFEFDNNAKHKTFGGGYIWTKNIDFVDSQGVIFDFKSLYPLTKVSGNLENPISKEAGGWHGSGVFKSYEEDNEDGILGFYNRNMGVMGRWLLDLFEKRSLIKKEIKKLDKVKDKDLIYLLNKKQLGTKIVLNSEYGGSSSPLFKSTYNYVGSRDTTALARQSIKYTKKVFEDNGYNVVYVHTDSCYIILNNHTIEDAKRLAEEISEDLRKSFNIYIPQFGLDYEKSFDKIYLFRGDDNSMSKGRNLIVCGNKAEYTGIKPKTANISLLGKHIFNKYIIPKLIKGESQYISLHQLYEWIEKESEENIDLLTNRFRCDELENYKAQTCLNAKISEKYGAGEHHLIPNDIYGVEVANYYYAKKEELEEMFGNQWKNNINLSKYLTDLSDFVLPEQRTLLNKLKRYNDKIGYKYRNNIIYITKDISQNKDYKLDTFI